ncbi:MAG: hypothetical protein L0Z50_42120 [Verrucomicrobiales bacterium]|nr:hypothetical protein [Verrucomicrobiales bacterium]
MKRISTFWWRRVSAFQALKPKDQRDLICLFLALTVIVLYLPVTSFGFVNYDDAGYVYHNPFVQQGLSRDSLWWALTTLHGNVAYWHPLTWLSHQLDSHFFGSHAGAHHLTSVLVHAANAILAFLITVKIIQRMVPAFFVALFFAIHPLRVESVAWVAERKDVLCAFFYFATIWLYFRYIERPSIGRYVAVVSGFLFALMSKPMAVTLPCVLLLLDFWPLRRFSRGAKAPLLKADPSDPAGTAEYRSIPGIAEKEFRRVFSIFQLHSSCFRIILEKAPLLGLAALVSFLAVQAQKDLDAIVSNKVFPFPERAANAVVAYTGYIHKTVLPINLSVHYNNPYRHRLPRIALAGIVFAVLSAVAVRTRKRYPIVLFGWLWFLGTLVPTIGLVQAGSQYMADRYTYIPCVGLLLMVLPLFAIIRRFGQVLSQRRIAIAGATTSTILSLLVTRYQLQYWKSTQSLFERAIEVDPRDFIAHSNLGITHKNEGRFDFAIRSLQAAMIGNSKSPTPKLAMGDLFVVEGKLLASLPFYFSALHGHDPSRHSAHRSLAHALCQMGQVGEAIQHYNAALQIRPGDVRSKMGLAEIYTCAKESRLRDCHKAVALAREICDGTHYSIPEDLYLLARAYAECGQFDKAIDTAQRASAKARAARNYRLRNQIEEELKLFYEHKTSHSAAEAGARDSVDSASVPLPQNAHH